MDCNCHKWPRCGQELTFRWDLLTDNQWTSCMTTSSCSESNSWSMSERSVLHFLGWCQCLKDDAKYLAEGGRTADGFKIGWCELRTKRQHWLSMDHRPPLSLLYIQFFLAAVPLGPWANHRATTAEHRSMNRSSGETTLNVGDFLQSDSLSSLCVIWKRRLKPRWNSTLKIQIWHNNYSLLGFLIIDP